MAGLLDRFPDLELGAASVCEPEAVAAVATAGCRSAMSPVLDPALLDAAAERDLVLVPGVMTASEVHSARRLGCHLVKLFPAVSVGIDHWRRLREPLGRPLPFCTAAGLRLLLKLLRVMGDCLGFDSFLQRSAVMPGGCNAEKWKGAGDSSVGCESC